MSQETAAPAAAPVKKSKKLLLIVAVVVVGIVGGGGAGAFLAGPLLAGRPPVADAAADTGADAADEHGEAGEAGAGTGDGTLVVIDNMVLNPARSNGARFLLVTIGLSVKDQAVADAMKARDPELRDAILRYLGAMPVEELADVALRDSLKVGIRGALLEHFGKGSVRQVYFPQFVIQ